METEKKPWWISEEEKAGLSTVPATPDTREGVKEYGKSLGNDVIESVPQLKMVDLSEVIAEYGTKDGLLNYHFYSPTRYAIRMKAEGDLEEIRRDSKIPPRDKEDRQRAIANSANRALDQVPWPIRYEEFIISAFTSVFPFSEYKVSFFTEVDSWSLTTPVPTKGLVTPERMELVIRMVNDALVKR